MTVRPTVGSYAEELYAALEPLAFADAENDWHLLILCGAIGAMHQQVRDYVRDTDDGPGWSVLFDVDRAPAEALPWLGQAVGVTPATGLPVEEQRDRIRNPSGPARGRIKAIKDAAQPTLTGTKTVIIRERWDADDPGPDAAYHLQVITLTAETPDPAVTEAAVLSQKAGGLILSYTVADGQDFEQLRATYDTFDDVRTAYDDFDELRTDT